MKKRKAQVKAQVNTWDKIVKVPNPGGWVDEIRNPNYRAPEAVSRRPGYAMRTGGEITTPPLHERIKACLLAHEAVCEDSVLVVTDTPVEKVGSIIVPDESKNTPLCGVVVLAGREAIEKGPPGLAVGRRVSYSMMAGVGYPFRGNWEARVLRYSEIRIVLRDKSGIPIYRKAMREAKL